MIDPNALEPLAKEMRARVEADRPLFDELRAVIRPLRARTQRIQPRSTTAISLVGTDGGENQIAFDPFMIQLVRVVDSNRNEYCMEVLSPYADLARLSRRHLDVDGKAVTPLGRLMAFLQVESLWQLSGMLPHPPKTPKPSWLKVYRELTEWAVLFSLVREHDFASDTVIVCDGFLRSKVFADYLFRRLQEGLEEGIARQYERRRRRIYLAGFAKRSKVIQRYRLAMAVEGVLRTSYPAFVEIPRSVEETVYRWSEYARGREEEIEGQEGNRFVAGKMFLAKFGPRPHDPIWAVDILESQIEDAPIVFGYLLGDAVDGFPLPYYPQCLQRAHENAALVDFDIDMLQDKVVDAVRFGLGTKATVLDEFLLEDAEPASARYG